MSRNVVFRYNSPMRKIRIGLDVFGLLQGLALLALLWIAADNMLGKQMSASAIGGESPVALADLERSATALRSTYSQAIHQEDVLRYQLDQLQRFPKLRDPEYLQQLTESRQALIDLLQDKKKLEGEIAQFILQIQEARTTADRVSGEAGDLQDLNIVWPVAPVYGVSAGFHDPEYAKAFGFQHEGIDIPVLQGTTVTAAADGTVERVVDAGMGYSYVILRHQGYATLYGHVMTALVQEGQDVAQGDPIALSGGKPGTPGAGPVSTGPHVHFEVIVGGKHINPQPYLPEIDE